MKIGVVVDNDLNGDIRVLREIRILKQHGFEVFTLCFAFSGKKYIDPVNNVSRIRIKKKLKDTLFFFMNLIPAYEWLWASRIRRLITDHNLDFLHVHDLYMSRAARMAIKRSGREIQIILDLHENYPFTVKTYNWTKGFPRKILSRPDAWKKKEHEYLGYADRLIVLSRDFRDALLSEYSDLQKKNFIIFPNVPDLSQPEYRSSEKASNPFKNNFPILFYYGVIAERRGIFDSLLVFEKIIKEDYPVNYLIIGPVDKKDKELFSSMTEPLISMGQLHYIPWINSEEFPSFLSISDICLAPFHKNPQHESGVANKIYDYMLGGKPVIASDCKPQKELIGKYRCGLIFCNNEEFHNSIIELLNNEPLRREMGENGKKAILNEFNADVCRSALLSAYNALS